MLLSAEYLTIFWILFSSMVLYPGIYSLSMNALRPSVVQYSTYARRDKVQTILELQRVTRTENIATEDEGARRIWR